MTLGQFFFWLSVYGMFCYVLGIVSEKLNMKYRNKKECHNLSWCESQKRKCPGVNKCSIIRRAERA